MVLNGNNLNFLMEVVVLSSTDTNTTYTVGDGGLTQNNFTNTLLGESKLDSINENYLTSLWIDGTAQAFKVLVLNNNLDIGNINNLNKGNLTVITGNKTTIESTTVTVSEVHGIVKYLQI